MNALRAEISVGPLPLTSGITTPNVVLFPLVNVRVLPLNDAVIKLLPVIADVTEPNEDVGTKDVLLLPSPTHAYPFARDAVKLPLIDKLPDVLTLIPIELPKPSCNPTNVDDAVLSVSK